MGTVYVMTNEAEGNRIAAFNKKKDGTLSLLAFYNTFGKGTGRSEVSPIALNEGIAPLQSQGSLAVSSDKRFLFAVNGGSNTITSFRITQYGNLINADVVPSGGFHPNSIALCGRLLYVTNVGNEANGYNSNVTGFRYTNSGLLYKIPNSSQQLSTLTAQPATAVFSPDGLHLVVTELNTDKISVFNVKCDGRLTRPTVNISNGAGPFGAEFLCSGILIVAESGRNALSSYSLYCNGTLGVISGSVANGQKGTSWVTVSKEQCNAYTSNVESGTISTYSIDRCGILHLTGSIMSTPENYPMGLPIDSDISRDGRFFYVLNGNQGTISAFKIDCNGQLNRIQYLDYVELPTLGTQGLVYR